MYEGDRGQSPPSPSLKTVTVTNLKNNTSNPKTTTNTKNILDWFLKIC